MNTINVAALAALGLSLGACGGNGDDKLGDQARQAADARAEIMDARADNTTGSAREALEANADATREEGEAREEAIDDSDVDADADADAMTNDQKAALINGN